MMLLSETSTRRVQAWLCSERNNACTLLVGLDVLFLNVCQLACIASLRMEPQWEDSVLVGVLPLVNVRLEKGLAALPQQGYCRLVVRLCY